MSKSSFINKLLGRKNKEMGGMTITITQDGHSSEGTSNVGTGTGGSHIRPIPLIGSLPAKTQYWIAGGTLLASFVVAAGLTVWIDKSKAYYSEHASSLTELKKSLGDLQLDSYRVSTGIDTYMPQAYIDMKRATDTFIYMRSTIFPEFPELKGPARVELDKAWNEWSSLKAAQSELSIGHVRFLTVRGKFAGVKGSVVEAAGTLKLLAAAKEDEASAETAAQASVILAPLARLQSRIENGESNVSFANSAVEADAMLGQLEAGLAKFSPEGIKDADLKKKVESSIKALKAMDAPTRKINALLLGVAQTREKAAELSNGAGSVIQLLEYVDRAISDRLSLFAKLNILVVLLASLGLLAMGVLAMINNNEGKKRTVEAKAENEANQRAIMSLLDEIANLADGDLTVRATVTEEITGAIADSVNFAISELSTLVTSIKKASGEISSAASSAMANSNQLQAISNKQSRDITDTGKSVLGITEAIEQVSKRMEDSKKVAQSSVQSSARGMQAVTASIEGIQSIQVNVEETGKRIKRLTEQSLQISEIVELIADISERTSVLAINATVQATKAGAAGKGFKVVADAVQDLANQASEATRKIGALINAIQTDIQGAGSAMQKTTEEAAKGAGLAEVTGEVLAEINDTSMALSEIVVEINEQIGNSARSAAEVSQTMKRVLASVSESSDATKSAAEAVEVINKLSEQLRESVSGFQI
jgi:twitching motility protein PilJ